MKKYKKFQWILVWSLIACVLVGCNEGDASDELEVIGIREKLEETEHKEVEEAGVKDVGTKDIAVKDVADNEPEMTAVSLISIYICGAVMEAGVYELDEGSRICDAITMAGGMTEEAMSTYLNQAELLEDGQMIYVPTMEEVENGEWRNESSLMMTGDEQEGLVNINTASKEELMTLTGIGEAKAESIIEYRETQGMFSTIEDIQNITGIKGGVFTKIEDEITT